MKLLSVTLSGIFAYEDEVRVNLSRTTSEQNIILIWGRNGKGKTSFINALKLLFSGIDNERTRMVGFPPVVLPSGQYVLGDGDHWMGIINRRVRRNAATSNTPPTASVEAVWESNGGTVTARREWSVANAGTFTERLMVIEGETRLTGPAAKDRLADFLPPDYVGFYFFDGEDIKALAETAERKNIDFDQLLRITFLNDLAEELREAALERRRRTLKPEERKELRELRRRLDDANDAEQDAGEQLREIEDSLVNEQVRLRRAETVRDNLSTGASEAQRKDLEENIRKTRKRIETVMGEVVNGKLPTTAPLLANLAMVQLAVSMLEKRLDGSGAVEQRVISRITSSLRGWIDDVDVTLSHDDKETLATGLVAKVNQVRRPLEDDVLLRSIDLDRAERLRDTLVRFASGGSDIRQMQVSQLTGVHRDIVELRDLDNRLMRLRVGSEANIERYRDTERQIKELLEKIATLNQRKGVQSLRLDTARSDQKRISLRRAELDALATRASKDEEEANYIEKVVEALFETREQLRRQARDEVETLMNERFRQLVHGNSLVGRIGIDDSYTLNFFDSSERAVGRASLSSGLKQLAATALLWAMKDASGREMPVIIDTPLGRIDRENQDNMLVHYYPNLSDQVIILPTNAEIDARKKAEIVDRIADEYSIENQTGDSAQIFPGSLETISGG